MSSLWNLGTSIIGASAEVATTAASGVGTAVYTGTTRVVNTTADVATGSLRRVGSTVSPYIPTDQISGLAQFAYSSTYYVSDNTIRAVQLLPNILDLCKTKETQNITLCCFRIIEKVLALLKGDEVIEITKLLMQIARSETTSQLLLEIKGLLIELFALLRTSEADALKHQLKDLVEGLQGIAREHQRREAAQARNTPGGNEQKLDESKEEVKEELDNPPSSPQVLKNIGDIVKLEESELELVKAVVLKSPNCATLVKKLALLDIPELKATELWNWRLQSEDEKKSNRLRPAGSANVEQNKSSEPISNLSSGCHKNSGIVTLLKSSKENEL